jgi:hypothetical protein
VLAWYAELQSAKSVVGIFRRAQQLRIIIVFVDPTLWILLSFSFFFSISFTFFFWARLCCGPSCLDVSCGCYINIAGRKPVSRGQVDGQDGDQNYQDDQVIPQRSNEEIEAHCKRRVERNLELRGHTLERAIGDLRGKVSTRSQLAKFRNHHAYISMVEPKKVFKALEDPDWLDAMHEELNNFKCNNVWVLVEKPRECRNVIGTK